MSNVFIRVLLGFIFGWFVGFLMTRSSLKVKYSMQGILHLVYDQDEPNQPKMGLEIESLDYIMHHDSINLTIKKIGFPGMKGPIYLKSQDDESA